MLIKLYVKLMRKSKLPLIAVSHLHVAGVSRDHDLVLFGSGVDLGRVAEIVATITKTAYLTVCSRFETTKKTL